MDVLCKGGRSLGRELVSICSFAKVGVALTILCLIGTC